MRGLVILLGLVTCEATAGSAFATGGSQRMSLENERAREKFRLGVNAFRAERLDEARQLLSEAWRLRRTYDVAASLAQVEHELGHYARAAELLEFCLNNFAPIENDAKFQQLRQTFDDVAKRVGRIDLASVPPGMEIRVDDAVVGTTPLATTMYLQPGLHEFTFRNEVQSQRRSLLVQAGTQHRFPIEPQHDGADPATQSARHPARGEAGEKTPARAPVASGGTRPTFPYYLFSALLVSGATTGIAFHVATNHASQRADDLRAHLGAADCSVPGATSNALCQSLADARAERNFNRNLAIFGYGVAGTAIVTMAIYWLWPESERVAKAEGRQNPTWALGYAPSQVWLSASGALP